MSNVMEDGGSELGARIAARVRGLRGERGYTLDTLAARSGVSRSAISMIERGETSPTAAVLNKLAAALGVPLASLFDIPPERAPANPVARHHAQPLWRDPQSGYLRRTVSPPGWPSPIRIAEVELPADAVVSYETAGSEVEIHQQIWILSGEIQVSHGAETHQLRIGDCLAMRLDGPTTFRNPTARRARYAVVVVTEPLSARKGAS